MDFLSAGADVISTVTYQAHYMPLPGKEEDDAQRRLRLDDAIVDGMLKGGVRLAKEAARQHTTTCTTGSKEYNGARKVARVAASIGSLGGSLADGSEYTGKFGLSIAEIESFHRRKVQVLAGEHPNILAFETIPCIEECCAILNILKEEMADGFGAGCAANVRPSIWLSFACSDNEHLNDGSKLSDALLKVDELDPDAKLLQAIGINCCSFVNGKCIVLMLICINMPNYARLPRFVRSYTMCISLGHSASFFTSTVKALTEIIVDHIIQPGGVPTRDIVLYPNSGEEWDASNAAWLEGTGTTAPDDFAQGIMTTVCNIQKKLRQQRGSKDPPTIIIGGCCRTTPETTAAIRRCIDTMNGQVS